MTDAEASHRMRAVTGLAAVRATIESAPLFTPFVDAGHGERDEGIAEPLDLSLSRLPRNDLGNALRMLRRWGDGLIYVINVGWHGWDGKRWNQAHGEFVARERAQATAEAIAQEAEALRAHFRWLEAARAREEAMRLSILAHGFKGDHEDVRRAIDAEVGALGRWSVQSGNAARTSGMLAQAEPRCRREATALDARPYLINFGNGTLELIPGREGGKPKIVLRNHDPADLLTRMMACDWQPDFWQEQTGERSASLWEAALLQILPAADQRLFLRRWFGYCVAGPPDEQAILIMSGDGANGKSVIVEAIEATMGDYALRLPVESLKADEARRGNEARPDLAELPGRRLAVASEPEGGMKFSTGMIKQLTERDALRVRQLHRSFMSFTPQHRLIVQCNERPRVMGGDRGTWRRLINLSFKQKFLHPDEANLPGNEGAMLRDDALPRKLKTELGTIAAWMVAGWLDYAQGGLRPPESVRDETERYRSENDPVGEFLRSEVQAAPGRHVTGANLYGAYKRWCEAGGLEPWSGTAFGRRAGAFLRKETKGVVRYVDVRLAADHRRHT
jgi:putative DNA primase/helicase